MFWTLFERIWALNILQVISFAYTKKSNPNLYTFHLSNKNIVIKP